MAESPNRKEFRHKCELVVLQCVPDPLKGERANVAVVLRDSNQQPPIVLVRFSERLHRLNCLEPGFDAVAFEEMLHQVDSVITNSLDFEQKLGLLENWPEELTVAPKMAVLTDSMEDEIELLAKQYLRARDWKQPLDEEETRKYLVGRMRNQFELKGAWRLMDKRLPVEEFTRKGDKLKLDCGYADRENLTYRIFHAVPLLKDCNIAKALAYSWPMIKDGMSLQHELDCEIKVIVANHLDRDDDTVAFGWETLERAGLQIEPLSRIPEFAEQARIALRA
ncbi:MAG TPA: DUF3037 domain-containing protein [Terriglobales bacterium]|nr:DUF3037 domain-containing protein [Terriglobales bacterium]